MEKKYKLTEETIIVNEKSLYRIEALKDFGNIKKGDKGGFIENEKNLSQDDDCWVYDDAKVYDNARVYDDAMVYGKAKVRDNAIIHNNAVICGNAWVYGDAKVSGKAVVCGYASIYDKAMVYGYAIVRDSAEVCGNAEICGNAIIANDSDYIVFKNWWSSGRYFTWTKSNNMWKVGCFYGSGKQLINKAYMDSELSGTEYERVVRYVDKDYRNS